MRPLKLDREKFDHIHAAFTAAGRSTGAGPYAEISTLWNAYLSGRQNFPTYEEFSRFLSRESAFVGGIGRGLPSVSEEAYLAGFRTWLEQTAGQFTSEELAQWPEPNVGEPTIVELNGFRASVLYIKNFAQAHFLNAILRECRPGRRGLRVLEIGAGYGGVAEILLRQGIAATYTVVDLPENLFLSSQFLQHSFPHLRGTVCNRADPDSFDASKHELRFVFPNDIELLGDKFDLVINVASLGEMVAKTAKAYVARVSQSLAENGLFISHNADRVRGEADVVQRHSDYGYDAFSLDGIYPNRAPGGPLHIQHVVCALGPGSAKGDPDLWALVDRFGALLNLGLNDEMEKLFPLLIRQRAPEQELFLERVRAFYSAATLQQKYAVASARFGDEAMDAVFTFLQGAVAFLAGNALCCQHFIDYVKDSRSPMAIALAALVLKRWDGCRMDADAERTFSLAMIRVPVYVINLMGPLRVVASQVRFNTYLQVP